MSGCEKLKEYILTDYIDGEGDPQMRKLAEAHLKVCPACARLAEKVKADVVSPFESHVRQDVPPHLWHSIKEKIENREILEEDSPSWIKNLVESLSLRRLAPVFASLFLFILVGSKIFYMQAENQARDKGQREYLSYLLESPDGVDSGTDSGDDPIESYFL